MGFQAFTAEDSMTAEYDKATRDVYPKLVSASSPSRRAELAANFADALGNPGEFSSYFAKGKKTEDAAGVEHILASFQHNTRLLVEKTWVEKSDQKRKERLLGSLDHFLEEFGAEEYLSAHRTFSSIANELAFLLFGEQSLKGDFIEYSFRIDPKLGLFWWFVDQLKKSPSHVVDPDLLRTELLIGIYFLASF
jgi:hypothetical protein